MEVRPDDKRLNLHVQSMVWRMQVCGDPFHEVLRMARSFRALPLKVKQYVFKYGLRDAELDKDSRKSKKVRLDLPDVTYTKWHLGGEGDAGDAET